MHTSHSFLHIAFDPIYAHPLPEDHRFPMLKYELLPGQLLHEGTITYQNLFSPKPCPEEIVLLTHDHHYIKRLQHQTLSPREQRVIGFPQSPQLTLREFIITQGTIDCCFAAFEQGIALNVAGGTHHAFAGRGGGFCMINDFAVAANYLLHERLVKKILIADLDVHQGNGTAKLFEHNENVFTFSMHGEHNYPFRKEKSDLDVGLQGGTGDKEYLLILKKHFKPLIEKVKPDLVFFLAGVDVLGTDKFGKLNLTLDGCAKRDEFVFEILRQFQIPCVVAMGGGYSDDIKIITEAHCNTFRLASNIFKLN